jgi:hypothetical protein
MLVFSLVVVRGENGAGQSHPRYRPTPLKSLNTPEGEDDPCVFVAKNGKVRRLYYVTKKDGKSTLMVSEQSRNGQWGAGRLVQGPDQANEVRNPSLSLDGQDLYLAAKFEGDNFDVGNAAPVGEADRFTAPTPIQAVSTPADEMYPWISADGRELYFNRKDKEGWRIYVASRPEKSGAFEKVKCLDTLPPGYLHPTLTSDGTTMLVQGSLENGRWGLFRIKRSRNLDRTWKPWGEPEALAPLNSTPEDAPVGDMSPSLSRDDARLYFASDRREGKGGMHLYEISAANLIMGVWKTKPKSGSGPKK